MEGKGKEVVTEEQAAHTLLNISSPAPKSTSSKIILKLRAPVPSSTKGNAPLTPCLEQPDDTSNPRAEAKNDDLVSADTLSDPQTHDQPEGNETPVDSVHEEFVSSAFPKIQDNLKLKSDDPNLIVESDISTGTLASLKNLESFGDQFLMDKPNDSDADKPIDAHDEAISMVDVIIQQDPSSIPTQATPTSPVTTVPTISITHTTEDTGPSTAHGTSQCSLEDLAGIVIGLVHDNILINEKLSKHENLFYRMEKLDIPWVMKNHNLRLSKLEKLNIEQRVSSAIEDQVAEAVNQALEAPLRSRFRDLPTSDMKDILHQRMFESKQYKEHAAHTSLYEALEVSMRQEESEQHQKDMERERKKKRKLQGHQEPSSDTPHHPPPPPPPSGASKPSGTGQSGSHQSHMPSPAPSSSKKHQTDKSDKSPSAKQAKHTTYAAWKTIDTAGISMGSPTQDDRVYHEESEIPESDESSDCEDDASPAHIPRTNNWWKTFSTYTPGVPSSNISETVKKTWWKDDRPTTPEPTWSVLPSDTPALENNWADAIADNFTPPAENSLLAHAEDMGSFMKWMC